MGEKGVESGREEFEKLKRKEKIDAIMWEIGGTGWDMGESNPIRPS